MQLFTGLVAIDRHVYYTPDVQAAMRLQEYAGDRNSIKKQKDASFFTPGRIGQNGLIPKTVESVFRSLDGNLIQMKRGKGADW